MLYVYQTTHGKLPHLKIIKQESSTPGKAGGLFCEPLKAVDFGTA
jgi:hypothetical protein